LAVSPYAKGGYVLGSFQYQKVHISGSPFGKESMPETKTRELAEAVFDRLRKQDAEINEALKLEAARHAAMVENMNRLKALRLARNEKAESTEG
jgi:hypothetical protein